MSSSTNDWTTPDFLSGLATQPNSAQSYIDAVTDFLNKNPAGTIFNPSPSSSSNTNNSPPENNVAQQDLNVNDSGRHDKRKSERVNDATVKDRRASDGASKQHTHGDVDYTESEDDQHGTGDKKKGKTTDRRRAQNRQAQRNFRERKERHMKELEERVVSLEQQTNDQLSENTVLKQLVQRLQSENERLKLYESAFSFSYDKDVSGSSAMPKAAAFGGSAPLPPPIPADLPRHSSMSSSSSSPIEHRNSDTSVQSLPASMPPSMIQTPTLQSSSASPVGQNVIGGRSSALDDALYMGAFAPSPASTTGESAGSSNPVATPPESGSAGAPLQHTNSDLFRSYREPSMPQFDDLDALFASVAPLTESLSAKATVPGLNDLSGLDDFSSFLKSPSPVSAGLTPPSDNESRPSVISLPSKEASAAAMNKAASAGADGLCPLMQVAQAEREVSKQDPKFVFDVDSLCADMKAKATCQEAARRALQEAMAQDEQTANKLFSKSNDASPLAS